MLLLTTILISGIAYAEDSLFRDTIPEPENDLQYFVFAFLLFFGFLAWLAYKVWINKSSFEVKKEDSITTNTVTNIDTQLAKDIAENARQIAVLEKNQEFQEKRFVEFKERQESLTNELFKKIDDLDNKLGTKVDNLVNAIIRERADK